MLHLNSFLVWTDLKIDINTKYFGQSIVTSKITFQNILTIRKKLKIDFYRKNIAIIEVSSTQIKYLFDNNMII